MELGLAGRVGMDIRQIRSSLHGPIQPRSRGGGLGSCAAAEGTASGLCADVDARIAAGFNCTRVVGGAAHP